MKTYGDIWSFWRSYVPAYKSKSFGPFFVRFPWKRELAGSIEAISARRSENRIRSYVSPDEIERVRSKLGNSLIGHGLRPEIRKGNEKRKGKNISTDVREDRDVLPKLQNRRKNRDVSIRFGVAKTGHGYSAKGGRGDFCLVGGVFKGSTLTLFYRSIELIGGFAFDLVLIAHLEKELGIEIKHVEIWSPKAFIFALKGNSNEKLYPKLRAILRG